MEGLLGTPEQSLETFADGTIDNRHTTELKIIDFPLIFQAVFSPDLVPSFTCPLLKDKLIVLEKVK